MSCAMCNVIVRGLFQSFEQGLTDDEIVDSIVATCTKLGGYSTKVCNGTAAAAVVRTTQLHLSVGSLLCNVQFSLR